MIVISHRGYWMDPAEKNTETAFKRSFDRNFGTETDIRDQGEDLVISHDMPSATSPTLGGFFDLYQSNNLLLALNIKSDGLQKKLKQYIVQNDITNYFVFDMSVPDTVGYLAEGMNVFCRQSEWEPVSALYDSCKGVWLDAFKDTWYDENLIAGHLKQHKKVAIVSAELHGRDHHEHWAKLKRMSCIYSDDLILCTDFPEQAEAYFTVSYKTAKL